MGVSWQTCTREEMKLLVILGCVACLAYTDASCFGRDAGFTPNSAKPVVSQPSRSDPNKVMVDWSKIVKNPQCVDSYNVVYWADGTPATSAKKVAVDKNTKSKIVEIQPCVGYRFAVEKNEPFYKRTAIIGSVLPPTTSRPGSRPAPTTKRPPVDKPMFLYWDDKTKQWVFGETLGGKSG